MIKIKESIALAAMMGCLCSCGMGTQSLDDKVNSLVSKRSDSYCHLSDSVYRDQNRDVHYYDSDDDKAKPLFKFGNRVQKIRDRNDFLRGVAVKGNPSYTVFPFVHVGNLYLGSIVNEEFVKTGGSFSIDENLEFKPLSSDPRFFWACGKIAKYEPLKSDLRIPYVRVSRSGAYTQTNKTIFLLEAIK